MNIPQHSLQLPGEWSTFGADYDWLFYFIYWTSVIMFVGVTVATLYFVVKYRRRPGVKAEPTGHNVVLEVTWTVAPVILLVMLFHWGFQNYVNLSVAPANTLDIRVRARKWSWDFEYPNGAHEVNSLHIPVNRDVRLILSSEDVIHAMFIPAFRVKRDAVPGQYETLWFRAVSRGTVPFTCAEYCGAAGNTPSVDAHGREHYTGHFSMGGNLVIQSQSEFNHFLDAALAPPPGKTPAQWGEMLYTQYTCNTCHSTNGSVITGPSWKDLWGRRETMSDGLVVTVDENYVRESILQPQAKIVRGFQPVMPTFSGSLNDRQIDAIIAYMRTLH